MGACVWRRKVKMVVPFNCWISGLASFAAGKKPLEGSIEACWEG